MKLRDLLIPACVMVLSGCGVLTTGKDVNYQSATRVEKPLEVPPDLLAPAREDRFAVPASGTASRADFEQQRSSSQPIAAARSGVLPQMPGMRLEQQAGQLILIVDQPAEKLWPLLRQFWIDSGFVIDSENPSTGLLETGWAEDRSKIPEDIIRRTIGRVFERVYDTGIRDRFRMRLERLGPNQTEVSLSHRGLIEVYRGSPVDGQTTWTNRPADRQLEGDFLRRIMIKLGAEEQRASSMVASGTASAAPVAKLTQADGLGQIDLAEGFDRAWRRVGVAIDRLGFTVEDRDRSQGVFFVRYRDPTAESKANSGGFFGRIFGPGGSRTESAVQYQVKLVSRADTSTVRILSEDGQPARDANAKQMLELLFEQFR